MKKKSVVLVKIICVSWVIATLMFCANPVDEPPLTWRSNVAAPLTNERFFIGQKMDSLFDFKNDISVLKNDTITFALSRQDSATYERTEKAFDTMEYRVKLGVLSIQGAPEQRQTLSFTGTGTHTASIKIPLQKMDNIIFYDTVDNYFDVQLQNTSEASLSNVAVTIGGLGKDSTAEIPPQSSHVFRFDVAGKSIIDSLSFIIELTSPDNGTVPIEIAYSMNGIKVFSMNVLDSLLAFSHQYVNRYELSDSIMMDYVDIAQGSFIYRVLNHSGISFSLSCIHDHIWNSNYCKSENIDELADFEAFPEGTLDSANFKGTVPNQRVNAAPNTQELIQIVDLSDGRLFPEWDTTINKSISNVRYTVETNPIGRYTAVSAIDSMQFTLATIAFKFREMAGTFVLPQEYAADTQKVAIDLPWNTTVKDSLRGKFKLQSVWADVQLRTRMSGNSHIDTLGVEFIVFDPESTTVQNTLLTNFVDVSNDSVYGRSLDITDVTNCFSDSIAITVKTFVPSGTKFRFSDTVALLDNNIIGRMVVDAYTDFYLNAKLDWEVLDTVNMDLGSSRLPLPEALEYFGKMRSRSGIFEVKIRNNTNLNILLYTLVAPDVLMDTLDSLTMNEMYAYLNNSDAASDAGYINLFSESGVTIPKRDTTNETHDSIILDESQISAMLNADSLNFRWWIKFKPQARDAMQKDDFIDIKSRLNLRGTNNTDSLMIWE